jgi:branched-chain amino acid transport system permease protein
MLTTQFFITVITLVGIFGVLTVALNLELGETGMIDFGLVAFFAAGAYIYTIFTQPPPEVLQAYLFGFELPIWIGLVAGGVGALLFALLTGSLTLRLRGEYFALTTFAFAEVFRSFLVNEPRFGNGTVGLVGLDRPFKDVIGIDYDLFLALVFSSLLIIVVIGAQRIIRSPYGRTLRMLRDDEVAALTSGKRVSSYRLQVFLVAAFTMGIAGGFYVWFTTLVTPSLFTAEVTFVVWIALIVGGVGSTYRAVLGITIIILFEELVRLIPYSTVQSAQLATSLRLSGLGLLLIVFLRWQPLIRLEERFKRRRAAST